MSELKSCTPTDIDSEKVIIQIENDAEKAFHSSDERVAHLAPFALAVILCTHSILVLGWCVWCCFFLSLIGMCLIIAYRIDNN